MRRTIAVAALSSVLSCLATLTAVGMLAPPSASAQSGEILRVTGVEIVDHEGKLRAYFGLGHVDSAGLWIHDKREGQRIELVHTYDDQARISVMDPSGTTRWRAP